MSFAVLNLGALVLLLTIWPGMHESVKTNPEGDALAQALRTHNVLPDDPVSGSMVMSMVVRLPRSSSTRDYRRTS